MFDGVAENVVIAGGFANGAIASLPVAVPECWLSSVNVTTVSTRDAKASPATSSVLTSVFEVAELLAESFELNGLSKCVEPSAVPFALNVKSIALIVTPTPPDSRTVTTSLY